MLNRLGVIGWPVDHSRSPQMQNAALVAAGLDAQWRYQLLPVAPGLLESVLQGLPAAGFYGVNVTIPYKEEALQLADQPSEIAAAIGAANHLEFRYGKVIAENTDAVALASVVQADFTVELTPNAFAGRRVLVLGAGGTGRTAASVPRRLGADHVAIWNRTSERARALAEEFGIEAIQEPELMQFDTLINTTPVGLSPDDSLDQLPVTKAGLRGLELVVDFAYSAGETPLTSAARAVGVQTVDGPELLVRQGAASFQRWTGVTPDLDVMRTAVSNT